MVPSTWIKQTWEVRKLEFDPTDALATGDSLSSVDTVKVYDSTGADKSTDMIEGSPQISGGKLYIVIKAGNAGEYYWLRIRVNTTNGDKIEDDLKVKVKQVGM